MVLLIIIPILNGYFIGGIPYFQTYPYSSMVRWFSHIDRWYIQSGNLPFLVWFFFYVFHHIFVQPETSIDSGICMDLPARWSPRARNWIVTSVRGTRYDGRQLAEVQWAAVWICQKDGTHDLYIYILLKYIEHLYTYTILYLYILYLYLYYITELSYPIEVLQDLQGQFQWKVRCCNPNQLPWWDPRPDPVVAGSKRSCQEAEREIEIRAAEMRGRTRVAEVERFSGRMGNEVRCPGKCWVDGS